MEHRKLFLIYDGISGAGKSTLLTELMHKRGFVDYALHRGPATEWVYGTINKDRIIDIPAMNSFEKGIEDVLPTVFILVECIPSLARQRKIAMGDQVIEARMGLAFDLFGIYFNNITRVRNKIRVNTSNTLSKCVTDLYNYLMEVQENAYTV